MSLIGIALNLLLAGLLASALAMGSRLNGRLKALRAGQEDFARSVAELNAAARRAEQGLAELRRATDEAVETLADRIEKGRALAVRLERLTERAPAPTAESPAPPEVTGVERRLGALLAAAREPRPERLAARREPPPRSRSIEDELFAEPLTLVAGGQRR